MPQEFTESIDAMLLTGSTIRPISHVIHVFFVCVLSFPIFALPMHAQAESAEGNITVVLKDFRVDAQVTQAKAGKLTFHVLNEGVNVHELVIIRTDLKPEAFPRKPSPASHGVPMEFLVNEDDSRIHTIDEIEEFPAGTSQKKTVSLEPGAHVLFCNIPGHFDKGMFASLDIVP